jgi:hypothetical protein
MGFGPMTGRAAGYCAGFGVPGFLNPSGGRFMGRGAWGGGGRGWRHWFHATGLPGWMRYGGGMYPYASGPIAPPIPDEEAELEALKEQAEYFERNLEGLRRRIQKLEAAPKTE